MVLLEDTMIILEISHDGVTSKPYNVNSIEIIDAVTSDNTPIKYAWVYDQFNKPVEWIRGPESGHFNPYNDNYYDTDISTWIRSNTGNLIPVTHDLLPDLLNQIEVELTLSEV